MGRGPTTPQRLMDRAFELVHGGRMSYANAAYVMGVSETTFRNWAHRARLARGLVEPSGRAMPPPRQTESYDRHDGRVLYAKEDDSGARCKCGLRLPCNNCIEPIYAYAEMRRDVG